MVFSGPQDPDEENPTPAMLPYVSLSSWAMLSLLARWSSMTEQSGGMRCQSDRKACEDMLAALLAAVARTPGGVKVQIDMTEGREPLILESFERERLCDELAICWKADFMFRKWSWQTFPLKRGQCDVARRERTALEFTTAPEKMQKIEFGGYLLFADDAYRGELGADGQPSGIYRLAGRERVRVDSDERCVEPGDDRFLIARRSEKGRARLVVLRPALIDQRCDVAGRNERAGRAPVDVVRQLGALALLDRLADLGIGLAIPRLRACEELPREHGEGVDVGRGGDDRRESEELGCLCACTRVRQFDQACGVMSSLRV